MRTGRWLITLAILCAFSVAPCLAEQALDIQMHLSQTAILLGEPDWVDVTVSNRTQKPLLIAMGEECFAEKPLVVEIPEAEAGSPDRDRTCYQGVVGNCVIPAPTRLDPGEAHTWRYVLEGDFRIAHPGKYRVFLQKRVSYAAPVPGENAFQQMQHASVQVATQTIFLTVRPANAAALLRIEQAIAAEVRRPWIEPPLSPAARKSPMDLRALRDAEATWREDQRRDVESRVVLAEGLADYPAPGMEPVFNEWMITDGGFGYGLRALYKLNSPEARQMLAQAADPSRALYLRWREHIHFGNPQQADKMLPELLGTLQGGAIYSLGRMGDKSYVPLLEKLTADSNAEVRQQAILGLGLLGGEAEIPKLVSIARSGATEADRQDAIMALGYTASLRAVPILIDLFLLPDADQPSSSNYALITITHHSLLPAQQRTIPQYQTLWRQWWEQSQVTAHGYGPFECSTR